MKKLDKWLLIIGTFTIILGAVGSVYTFQSLKKERLKQQLPLSDTLVDATLDLTDLPYENISIYQTEQTAFEFQEQGLPRNIKVKATTKDNQSIVQFDWQKSRQNKTSHIVFSDYDKLDIYVPAHLESLHISSGQSKLKDVYIADLTLKTLTYQLNAASLSTQAIHTDNFDVNYHGNALSLENNQVMDEMTLNGVAQQMFVQGTRAKNVTSHIETQHNTWRDIQAEKTTIDQKKGETTFFNPTHNVALTSKSGPINVYLEEQPDSLDIHSSYGDLTLIVPIANEKQFDELLHPQENEKVKLNTLKGKQYLYYAYPDKEQQFILSNKKSLTKEERDEYRVYSTPYEIIWENLRGEDD
ncbi:MAG: DUF4097 family beta strand repeat-containing protein [Vagococcus sp.]|nr:DUF4097 family beta strand repeat-containing protein [Vagococcus sp.]